MYFDVNDKCFYVDFFIIFYMGFRKFKSVYLYCNKEYCFFFFFLDGLICDIFNFIIVY